MMPVLQGRGAPASSLRSSPVLTRQAAAHPARVGARHPGLPAHRWGWPYPDRRRNHSYIRVEWQMTELNGRFYLAPPKEGSRRDVDIPRWLFDL
ncbi:MAG TPA: hypothetical protein VGS06_44310, partial [Streptosporangiaceae bacterium]|nr:hypothetical protein [Streptosporangiaceae bacterium]